MKNLDIKRQLFLFFIHFNQKFIHFFQKSLFCLIQQKKVEEKIHTPALNEWFPRGHVVCGECKPKVATCPQCREVLGNIR